MGHMGKFTTSSAEVGVHAGAAVFALRCGLDALTKGGVTAVTTIIARVHGRLQGWLLGRAIGGTCRWNLCGMLTWCGGW